MKKTSHKKSASSKFSSAMQVDEEAQNSTSKSNFNRKSNVSAELESDASSSNEDQYDQNMIMEDDASDNSDSFDHNDAESQDEISSSDLENEGSVDSSINNIVDELEESNGKDVKEDDHMVLDEESDDSEAKNVVQKLLRASVLDEIDRSILFPGNTSVHHERSIHESSIIKNQLKELKSHIESISDIKVVWKSKSSKRKSVDSSSSNSSEFEAKHFFEQYFADCGHLNDLMKDIEEELEIKESNEIFNWSVPSKIGMVGSYILGTCLVNRDLSESFKSKKSKNSRENEVPIYTLDLSVTLPQTMFKHKDIKGHRYEYKRMLYLAVLSTKIEEFVKSFQKSNENNLYWAIDGSEDIMMPHLQFNIDMDILDEQSKSSKKRKSSISKNSFVSVKIRPIITPSTFKLSQLLPWKPQLHFDCAMPSDHISEAFSSVLSSLQNLIPEAPKPVKKALLYNSAIHNHHILQDSLIEMHLSELTADLQAFGKYLRDAIVLTQRWLQSRRLLSPFNGFVVSMMYSHLCHSNMIRASMEALEMFKIWLKFICKQKQSKELEFEKMKKDLHGVPTSQSRDIHTEPPVLVMSHRKQNLDVDSKHDFKPAFNTHSEEKLKVEFNKIFETVFIDRTGYMNLFSKVSASNWENLEFEAFLTCKVMELPDQYTFNTIFKKNLFVGNVYRGVAIDKLPPLHTEFDIILETKPSHLHNAPLHLPLPIIDTKIDIYDKIKPHQMKQVSNKASKSKKPVVNIITLDSQSQEDKSHLYNESKSKEASESLQELANHPIKSNHLDLLILQKQILSQVLQIAFAPRVEYFRIITRLDNKKHDCLNRDDSGKSLVFWSLSSAAPSRASYWLGLMVQPTQWQKILEHGPQAQNTAEVEEFMKIWGKESCGLRKFKDGLILYCVSWGDKQATVAVSERHRIPLRVVEHLISKHLASIPSLKKTAKKSAIHETITLEQPWNVTLVGDDVFFDMLNTIPQIHPNLIPNHLKASGFANSLVESHVHVRYAWNQLQKALRELKGLPLAIKTLTMPGPLTRGSHATPPLYNPLCDPEISLNQRKAAIDSATSSMLCPSPIDVIMTFEGSGQWPDDLESISHLKTSFYILLSTSLQQQHQYISTRVLRDSLIIFFKGYTFKLEIFYPREIFLRSSLHRQAVLIQRREQQQQEMKAKLEKLKKANESDFSSSKSKLANFIAPTNPNHLLSGNAIMAPIDTHVDPLPEVEEAILKYDQNPKTSNLLHSLNLAYPAFGPTCILVKKWMSKHLITVPSFADGLLTDLIVARVFQNSNHLLSPWSSPPNHAYQGFYRVLYLLSKLDWESGPLIVPLEENEEESGTALGPLGWSVDKIHAIQKKWDASSTHPVFSVAFSDGSSRIGSGLNDDQESILNQIENQNQISKRLPGVTQLDFGTVNQNHNLNQSSNYSVHQLNAAAMMKRMKLLATQSSNLISFTWTESNKDQHAIEDTNNASMQKSLFDESLRTVFAPALLDFDLCIELKKHVLTKNDYLNVDPRMKSSGKPSSKHEKTIGNSYMLEASNEIKSKVEILQKSLSGHSANAASPPLLVGFDPVQNLLEMIQKRFGDKCLLFHDSFSGPLIGLVWKPSAFAINRNLVQNNVIDTTTLINNEGKREGVVPNIMQMMNEMYVMGEGLIQKIHLVGGQHKISK